MREGDGHHDGRNWHEDDWGRVVEQIRTGECTPFLGAGACSGILPTGAELSERWATSTGYPFLDCAQLHDVMQYATVLAQDPVTVKRRVTTEDFAGLPEPDYADPNEIHGLLARHPIEVYLTTNYDDFMTRALVQARRSPVTALCPWWGAHDEPDVGLPDDYQPSTDRPLVYHLHGKLDQPRSLVLAEQDYVEFLYNLARDEGGDDRRVVPYPIIRAMSQTPLLFIGYSLRDWSFRMLFHAVVAGMPPSQQRRHVSVQLVPDVGPAQDAPRRAMDYLTRYYGRHNISVFWGTSRDFGTELAGRLEAV